MRRSSNARKIARIALKIFLGLLLLLVLLFSGIWVLLSTQWGNKKLTGFTVSYLEKKFRSKVAIGSIDLHDLSRPQIIGVNLFDPSGNLVASLDTLKVGICLEALLSRSIDLQMVNVTGLKLRVIRSSRTGKFNYQFILDAFDDGRASPKDTSSGTWNFSLEQVSLRQLDVQYVDAVSRDSFLVKLGSLQTNLKGSDVGLPSIVSSFIQIDSLQAYVQVGNHPASDEPGADNEPLALALAIRALQAGYVDLRLRYVTESLVMHSVLGKLDVRDLGYKGLQRELRAGLLRMDDHLLDLQYSSQPTDKAMQTIQLSTSNSASSFSVSLDSLLVNHHHYKISQSHARASKPGVFDPGNIELKAVNLVASGIFMKGNQFGAKIHDVNLKDGQGFVVKQLNGELLYADTALQVRDLHLVTKRNDLAAGLRMTYPSISAITSLPARTKINLDIKPSSVVLDELSYFVPSLKSQQDLRELFRGPIKVQGIAKGTLDDLNISDLVIRQMGNSLSLSARVQHMMNPSALIIQSNISKLTIHKTDLKKVLGSLIPETAWAYVPEDANINGKLGGTADNLQMDLKARTSLGEFAVSGRLMDPSDPVKAVYDLQLETRDLALQKILKDTSLGPVTGSLTLKGAGYDLPTMRASIDGKISKAGYQGYVYQDIRVNGKVEGGKVDAAIKAGDPHVDLDLDVSGHFNAGIRDLMVDADLRAVDLQAIGFMKDPFVVRGKINADADHMDSSSAAGSIRVDDLILETKQKTYFLDTLSVVAYQFADTQYIKLNTPFAHATLKGIFKFNALPVDVKEVVNGYMQTRDTVVRFTKPAYADLHADVHIPDTLIALVPGLKKLSPFTARFILDTKKNSIIGGVKIPEIAYGDYTVDSLMVGIGQDETNNAIRRASVAVSLERFTSPWASTNRVYLAGMMDRGLFKSGLILFDKDNKTMKYAIPFSYYNDPQRPYLSLGDSLILNTYDWEVNKDNKVYLNPAQLGGSNLHLFRGTQELRVSTADSNASGFPLTVQLKGFLLESVSALLNADSALIKGEVNASASFDGFDPLRFTSGLGIKGLAFMGSSYGDLTVDVHSMDKGNYTAKLGLHGSGNDLDIDGNYTSEDGAMRANAMIKALNLAPLAPFARSFVDSLQGVLSGDLALQGTTASPMVNGQLSLDSTRMILVSTGVPLVVPKAEMLLDGRSLRINEWKVLDSAGMPAYVKGELRFDSLSYNLKFDTKRFLVAGHKRYKDQLLYGPLRVASALSIIGDLDGAMLNGKVDVLDSSEVTYVYRENEVMSNADGLIEFFNPADSTADSASLVKAKAVGKKFALSANTYIDITPSSTLNIVLSEESGDRLRVKGKSSLNFSMNESGGMELVGNYEVESGTYNLSIAGLIHKEFAVDKGSSITWTGDVKKASVNLTAVYNVKTDAAELVQDIGSIPGISKQKFDFLVYMDITGDLLKPNISFRIDMKEEEQAAFDGMVYTRIKQVNSVPSELNKQVMGLLALQTFIADNPFSSVGGGGSFQTDAFSTAGNMLTKELNNFIGNAIKDVDIDIGLDIRDDYSSGTAVRKSDLKVGLAKSFNNNRLNVYVGSTFALENQNQQQDLLNGLAGDVTLEYLLTRDGRYRLKGYRVNKHDLTFNGTVVETGATFVVVVEFNKLKNAFRRKRNQ